MLLGNYFNLKCKPLSFESNMWISFILFHVRSIIRMYNFSFCLILLINNSCDLLLKCSDVSHTNAWGILWYFWKTKLQLLEYWLLFFALKQKSKSKTTRSMWRKQLLNNGIRIWIQVGCFQTVGQSSHLICTENTYLFFSAIGLIFPSWKNLNKNT